ncbi:winged helix-turn-helix transcriptional regulator [Mycobacterium hodleri]|nr:winged helix-turn-helix transcriptional regulator [Mycolicibacterium hodleri]
MGVELAGLFSELVRLETELWNAVDARLRADFDLPLPWFEPMQVIARVPSCRVFDIATDLSITVGGTSKLVDRLEAAGHCARVPNPDDRRSSVIELTPSGRRLLAKASTAFEDELQVRIGSVSTRQLQQFESTVVALRRAVARVEGDGRSTA